MASKQPVFFVDTSFSISFFLASESNHQTAKGIIEAINAKSANPRFVTTDYVVIETLCSIWGHGEGSRHQRRIVAAYVAEQLPAFCRIIHIGPNLFPKIRCLFQERLDLEWSFVDCSSFVILQEIMRESKRREPNLKAQVLSFDRHFYSAQDEFDFEVFC